MSRNTLAIIPPPSAEAANVFVPRSSGVFSVTTRAVCSESADISEGAKTVRCPPRRLWTVPPQVDERTGWMRAMSRGEESVVTVIPSR